MIAECFGLIREAIPGVQVAAYSGGKSTDFMLERNGTVDWLRVPHEALYGGTAGEFVREQLPKVALA
jgi:beta-lactamase superfamily II metal-dependent hydrolase